VSERIRSWVAVTVIAACAGLIVAVLATADPSPADRVEALATRLKCPVCQSESINDSPAQLSRDLKALIADQVADGWTDQQIVDFFIATYGEEVLLDPPAGGRTALRTMPRWNFPRCENWCRSIGSGHASNSSRTACAR